MRKEVAPKNILMIGPTGVGKTEIARRLATLTGAPFIKVEATKYTEVGYYGRDVESMIRELVENAIGLVRERELDQRRGRRPSAASTSGCSTCSPRRRTSFDVGVDTRDSPERYERTREKMRAMLARRRAGGPHGRDRDRAEGPRDDDPRHGPRRRSAWTSTSRACSKRSCPRTSSRRQMTVAEARRVLFEQETEALINAEKVNAQAIELAENVGHHLRRRDGQGRGQRRRPRRRRLAAGRAARPAADRRGHDRQTRYGYVQDRPHPVHRRRRVPHDQAVAT